VSNLCHTLPFFHGTSQSHKRAYPKTTTGNETALFLSLAILLQCKEEEKPCMYKKKKSKDGSSSTRSTRQIKAPKHKSLKNITIKTSLIH
jgi:hypothetical protein